MALLASLPASDHGSPPTAAAAPPARRVPVVDEHGAPVAGARVAVAPAVTVAGLGKLPIDCESRFAAAERLYGIRCIPADRFLRALRPDAPLPVS